MRYSGYIFRKVFSSFLMVMALLISLIWFSRAISFVKYITDNGVSIEKFLLLFLLILPWLLIFIIPISLFCAIITVVNKMIVSNEISILKNSGLTKFQISKPVIFLAIIVTLLSYSISFYIMPYANKHLRIMKIDFVNNYTSLSFKPKTFETLNNLTIYARDRDDQGNLFGLILHDERSAKNSITVTATMGNIFSEGSSALLNMKNGAVQRYNYETGGSEILSFDSYVFGLSKDRANIEGHSFKPREQYFSELFKSLNLSSNNLDKIKIEIHKRIIYPFLSIILSLVGMSCMMRGSFRRGGNGANIILAIFIGLAFISSVIASYDLVEGSPNLAPILYFNLIFFTALSCYMLKENFRKL